MNIWTEQTTQEQKKQDTARLEKELNWLLDTLNEWRNRVDEIEPKVYVGDRFSTPMYGVPNNLDMQELHKLVEKVDKVITELRLGIGSARMKRALFDDITSSTN